MRHDTLLGSPLAIEGSRGNRIACTVAGPHRAQPVVVTSGIGCGPVFFKHIAPALARDYRVVFWHYRAHGPSGKAPDGRSYRVEDHATDLDDVVRRLCAAPPVLVGFSMGVQVTVEWFARHGRRGVPACVFLLGTPRNPLRASRLWGSERLRRLVERVLDAGGDRVARGLHPVSKAVLRNRLSYEIAVRWGLVTRDFAFGDYLEFIRYSTGVEPDAYLRTATGVLAHDALETWRGLEVPTLYVAGERDFIVPAAECRGVVRDHPDLRYRELRRRSHAGMVEEGPALARAIKAFVDDALAGERLPAAAPAATVERSVGPGEPSGSESPRPWPERPALSA
jgi:3-oxoadipate enol-lactonase